MPKKIIFVSLFCLIQCFPTLFAQVHISPSKKHKVLQQIAEGTPYIPGKIILKIDPELSHLCDARGIHIESVETLLSRHSAKIERQAFPNLASSPLSRSIRSVPDPHLEMIYEINFPSNTAILSLLKDLLLLDAVAYAEPLYIYETFHQPNDVLTDTTGGENRQWYLDAIFAREAWDLQRDDTTVVVGVVDSGFSFEHEDLQDNILFNYDDPIDGIDNDQDGYVDNFRGWDLGGSFLSGEGDNDPGFNPSFVGQNHGIAVAGGFAATANNGIGVAGVGYNCKYIPIKGAADEAPSSIAYGYQGIIYAIEQGADIVNCSWGGRAWSQFGEDVVNFATFSRGVAIVAASGNNGGDVANYPAAFPNVLSVANTTLDNKLFYGDSGGFTAYHHTVNVAAPGVSILTPTNDAGYNSSTGTSFSAPVAAGAVALVKGYFPQYSGFQASERLRVTADDIYSINPPELAGKMGNGEINAFRALNDGPLPSLRIRNYTITDLDGDNFFLNGDTLQVVFDGINYLEASQNVVADLSFPNNESFVTNLDDPITIGTVLMNGTFSANQGFRFVLDENMPFDISLGLRIGFRDDDLGYKDFQMIDVVVNPSYVNLTENDIQTTIPSQGNLGFNDFGSLEEGLGLIYNDERNALFEAGFLVGDSHSRVSDPIRNATGRDEDFSRINAAREVKDNPLADTHIRTEFTDANAPSPLNVGVMLDAYAFSETGEDEYVILQYTLTNQGTSALNNVYGGIFADWDIFPLFNKNISSFDSTEQLIFAYNASLSNPIYYGLSLLNAPDKFHGFSTTNPSDFVYNDSSKYEALKTSASSTNTKSGLETGGADVMHFISSGPHDILPAAKDTLSFAMMASASYTKLVAASRAANEKYRCVILGQGPNEMFTLSQNPVRAGQGVTFTDNNSSAISWEWNFGVLGISDGQSITRTFPAAGTYPVTLTVSDGVCTVKLSRDIQVDFGVDIEEIGLSQLDIFPNPSSGNFQISYAFDQVQVPQIDVFSLQGKHLLTDQLHAQEGKYLIDLGGEAPGIYVLKIHTQNGTRTWKLVKM